MTYRDSVANDSHLAYLLRASRVGESPTLAVGWRAPTQMLVTLGRATSRYDRQAAFDNESTRPVLRPNSVDGNPGPARPCGDPVTAPTVEVLHTAHGAALRRFLARMLGCEQAAADAAQETWLRLTRLSPRQTIDNPRAYVFQVAANVARDHLAKGYRRNAVVTVTTQASEDAICPGPTPEAEAVADERLRLLAATVDALPPRCREVFLMSRLDGLANGEIAARLSITRNAVEKNIIRAMLHCRRALDTADQ